MSSRRTPSGRLLGPGRYGARHGEATFTSVVNRSRRTLLFGHFIQWPRRHSQGGPHNQCHRITQHRDSRGHQETNKSSNRLPCKESHLPQDEGCIKRWIMRIRSRKLASNRSMCALSVIQESVLFRISITLQKAPCLWQIFLRNDQKTKHVTSLAT